MKNTETAPLRALLISIRTPDISAEDSNESLAELERLVTTLGFLVVGKERQNRTSTKTSHVLGRGKLLELARLTGNKSKAEIPAGDEEELAEALGLEPEILPDTHPLLKNPATVVVLDCDLTPSQLRNLETAFGVEVLDRTGVIIEIFSRHAKSRAAKLQVEIARLKYQAPRLREVAGNSAGERQGGRGAGESALELDRRNIRDRITFLKTELESVQREQSKRRAERLEQATVALVGYTNAGKSSLMRALTGSQVLVEDKLFATLDTTVRALYPDSQPRILVTDTVGFVKKLPHDLVASFKSTLDEALSASLLLFVVDSSDPSFRSQLEVTRQVLDEVGAESESLLVFNKIDKLSLDEIKWLKREFRDAILISTLNPEDIRTMRERIINHFEKGMVDEEVFVRYDIKGIIGDIRSEMRVLRENFENEGVRMLVRARQIDLARLRKKYALN